MITDHSDYLGIYRRLAADDPQVEDWEVGQRWAKYLKKGTKLGAHQCCRKSRRFLVLAAIIAGIVSGKLPETHV